MKKHIDIIGDLGVPLSFPIAQAGFYYLGKKNNDSHMMQFSMEYLSAMYLAMIESSMLSYIQIHHRPSNEGTSFWEEKFRAESSFPSGHIIPYAVLFFKTLQFYGPLLAAPPLLLTIWASMQRVQDGKHWTSDVVGAFFLSAFASEGVRSAAKYSKNNKFYKMIFENNLQFGLIRHQGHIFPKVSLEF